MGLFDQINNNTIVSGNALEKIREEALKNPCRIVLYRMCVREFCCFSGLISSYSYRPYNEF